METLTPDAALRPLWDCDLTDGRDECNLAEFPLASLASRTAPGQKTLSFTDEMWDKGTQQRIVRKLTISGSDQFGLPTARDNDVLVSLLCLTKCRNNFQSPKVHFTRYELVKFMHWDDGGKSYRRLERSLNVLAGVTLFYNRAWWDLAGKSWRNQTFHILESVDLRGRESAGADEQPLSSITWNGTLFGSFTASYIKKLNMEIYFQLQGAAARQAYRFLDKRFYHKRVWEFDLRAFACEHLGLGRGYDTAQLKRKLRPAIEELEWIGFLKRRAEVDRFVKRGPGAWTIVLEKKCRAGKTAATAVADGMAAELTARGVSPEMASELSQQFDAGEIERQVAAFDQLPWKQRQRIANPAGYLVQAIRRSFTTKTHTKKRQASRASTPPQTPPPVPDPQRLAREAFWVALSESERADVETTAFADAEPFTLAGWKRACEDGLKTVAAGYRQAILDRELDRRIADRCVTLAKTS